MTKGTKAAPASKGRPTTKRQVTFQIGSLATGPDVEVKPLSVNHMTYTHYFRDVRHLKGIDIYRVIKLWDITDPALQHALKKVVCAGGRGAKDVDKDIQEAIDALKRFQEMRHEDSLAE